MSTQNYPPTLPPPQNKYKFFTKTNKLEFYDQRIIILNFNINFDLIPIIID